ncbi:MAG: hypothetical protein FJX64_03915 [Alphaproteobacteria bacterium]|nr:hypothetical protein [Alphaproteobacteria bacterium]
MAMLSRSSSQMPTHAGLGGGGRQQLVDVGQGVGKRHVESHRRGGGVDAGNGQHRGPRLERIESGGSGNVAHQIVADRDASHAADDRHAYVVVAGEAKLLAVLQHLELVEAVAGSAIELAVGDDREVAVAGHEDGKAGALARREAAESLAEQVDADRRRGRQRHREVDEGIVEGARRRQRLRGPRALASLTLEQPHDVADGELDLRYRALGEHLLAGQGDEAGAVEHRFGHHLEGLALDVRDIHALRGALHAILHHAAADGGAAHQIGLDGAPGRQARGCEAGDELMHAFQRHAAVEDGLAMPLEHRAGELAVEGHAGDEIKRRARVAGGIDHVERRKQEAFELAADVDLKRQRPAGRRHHFLGAGEQCLDGGRGEAWAERVLVGLLRARRQGEHRDRRRNAEQAQCGAQQSCGWRHQIPSAVVRVAHARSATSAATGRGAPTKAKEPPVSRRLLLLLGGNAGCCFSPTCRESCT